MTEGGKIACCLQEGCRKKKQARDGGNAKKGVEKKLIRLRTCNQRGLSLPSSLAASEDQ